MSDFNNKYGKSNLCPSIMNDGRGVKTNFKNNQQLVQDLKKSLNAKTSQEFRNELQNKNLSFVTTTLNTRISDFTCDKVPHGEVTLSKEIKLENGDEGSFLDNFKPLV
jgi:hypothetical protein